MSKITFGSVFGNYKWSGEAEVSREQMQLLAPLGALQIAQRSPSTAAEKEMAAYDKRPQGFKRTTIPFTQQGAEMLQKHLSSLQVDENVSIPVTINVEEYVAGEGVESKFVAERAKYVQRAANLAKLAEVVGYAGEVGDGTADNAPMPFLQAIRAWVRAQADKL